MAAADGTVADGTVDCCGANVGFPDVFDGVVLDVPLELFVEPVALSRGRASRCEPVIGLSDVSAGVVVGNPAALPAAFDPPAAPAAFDPTGAPLRGLMGVCLVAALDGGAGGGVPPVCGVSDAGLFEGTFGGGPPGPPGCGNAVEAGGVVDVVVAGVVGAKVVGVFLGDNGSPAPPGAAVVPSVPCDTTAGNVTLTGARAPAAVGDPPGTNVSWCCRGSTVTVRGGWTNRGIGAAETGKANRSRGTGGGARATNSRGRGGRNMIGAGGGGAKPGPANIMTGRSTNTTSVGGGGAIPKSKIAKLGGGSRAADRNARRRCASQTCGPFG
jgi:hypothetical protein